MKYFFSKSIVIEELVTELDTLDLSDRERHHLAGLIDSSLYNVILDEVLSNLSGEDKKLFLKKLSENPEDEKLMDFLGERIDNIEEKVKLVSSDLIKEMHKDLKEAKKQKL